MAKISPRAAERRSQAGKRTPMRQIETSMSKKYKGTPKVSQRTIDKIKSLGMTAALKQASTNKNPEFREGLRRMYGAARVKKAMAPAVKKAAPSQKQSPRVVERTRPAIKKTSPRAVESGSAKAPVNKDYSKYSGPIPKGYKRTREGKLVKKGVKLKLPRLSMGVKQYK